MPQPTVMLWTNKIFLFILIFTPRWFFNQGFFLLFRATKMDLNNNPLFLTSRSIKVQQRPKLIVKYAKKPYSQNFWKTHANLSITLHCLMIRKKNFCPWTLFMRQTSLKNSKIIQPRAHSLHFVKIYIIFHHQVL